MADLTITETALGDGRVRYELGRPNWQARRIPDIRSPGATVQIADDRLIDIVVLGDGYTDAADFRAALTTWLQELYAIEVYERFAGCLRIRALYTPSSEAASASRGSYYGCPIATDGGIDQKGKWWEASGARNDAFREAFWASVDTFDDLHLRRYPDDLTTNQELSSGELLVIDQDELRGLYRNLVVSMLVQGGPSGFNGLVPRPAPDQDHYVKVAFGAYEIHELSHALGMLHDEYIHHRTEEVKYRDPVIPSVFSLSNVRFSDQVDQVPWLHLSPWGLERRSAGGQSPSPVVGWMWLGGGIGLLKPGSREIGAWHSEYRCLMNGGHDNYLFTQLDSDPTNLGDGTIKGADLRDKTRLCLWCQELVTIRLLEKTDQLIEPGDPADITAQGQVWYTRWVQELRAAYLELYDVRGQIAELEDYYAKFTPGPAGEPLWQSDLYSVPKAAPAAAPPPAAPLADDELLLVTVAAG
jgi:hypothetical protein